MCKSSHCDIFSVALILLQTLMSMRHEAAVTHSHCANRRPRRAFCIQQPVPSIDENFWGAGSVSGMSDQRLPPIAVKVTNMLHLHHPNFVVVTRIIGTRPRARRCATSRPTTRRSLPHVNTCWKDRGTRFRGFVTESLSTCKPVNVHPFCPDNDYV